MRAYGGVWSHARILKPSQQHFEVTLHSFSNTERFGASGNTEPIGTPYLQSQSYQNMIEAAGVDGLELRSILEKEGVNLSSTVSTTEFQLEGSESQIAATWSRGLTSRWMVGARVPYIQSKTQIQTQTRWSPGYLKLREKLNSHESTLSSAEERLEESRVQNFSENDWDEVSDEISYQGLGDIELLSQWLLGSTAQWKGAFRQRIHVPTGKNQDPYTYIKPNTADGQLDLGADILVDYSPTKKFLVTGIFGYTLQMADKQAVRIPDQSGSPANWKVDYEVERDLGDIFLGQFNTELYIFEKLSLHTGYEYSFKSSDSYSGSKFQAWQYEALGTNSEQKKELARIGIKYHSRSWRTGEVGQGQLVAGLEYLSIVAGENTPKIDAAAFDLSFFY